MIAAIYARKSTAAWLLCAFFAAGCQLYWSKPDMQHYGAVGPFANDHRECIRTAGVPPGAERVLVNLDLYRACLKSKGWQRVTGAKGGVSAGMMRGQEDEGPVSVDDFPRQTPVMTPPASSGTRWSTPNFGPR